MDRLVEFRTEDGARIVVEADDDDPGVRLVARDDTPARAAHTFEGALNSVRAAAESALRVLRDGTLRPDGVEIEFGVKLAAEAGAVIAKGTAEGHLVVRLSWNPGARGRTDGTDGTDATGRTDGMGGGSAGGSARG